MKKRILYIEPVGSNRLKDEISRYIASERAGSPDTIVDVACLSRGPMHLEYRYYQALVLADILHELKKAERGGYDAAIIGCYYDPGLQEAREIASRLVVVGPAEASMHIATSLGRRFSVIVGREKWIPQMYENVVRCGFADRISSFETIGSRPHDLQADKQETERRLTAAARRAIDDKRAEVIILGGTLEFGFYRQLQEKLSVPVIDSLIASVKYAELMVDLRRDFNWATSRKYSFESPPQQELRDFKIEEQYSISRATKNSSTMLTSET